MSGEVREVGKGFLTGTGELKTKAQLAKEETQVIQEDSVEVSPQNSEERLSNAVGNIKSRFREQANSIGSVINQDQQNLKEAAKAVKEELEAAQDLKSAFKENDKKKIEAAQERLEKANAERNAVADRIKEDNKELAERRVQALNVGNEQRGIVKTKAVELKKREENKPQSADETDELVRRLREDRGDITTQRQELRAIKQELKSEVSSTEERLAATEANTIRDLQRAEETAKALAERIAQNQSQALAANRVSESIARQLLQ